MPLGQLHIDGDVAPTGSPQPVYSPQHVRYTILIVFLGPEMTTLRTFFSFRKK